MSSMIKIDISQTINMWYDEHHAIGREIDLCKEYESEIYYLSELLSISPITTLDVMIQQVRWGLYVNLNR